MGLQSVLFFVVLVIALGWAGWLWAWGRDRYVSGDLGLPPNPFAAAPTSRLAAPNTQSKARQRRREVLGTLAVVTLLSILLARAWSLMYVIAFASLCASLSYAWAVYRLEVDGTGPTIESMQRRFGPVVETEGPAPSPSPQPLAAEPLDVTSDPIRS